MFQVYLAASENEHKAELLWLTPMEVKIQKVVRWTDSHTYIQMSEVLSPPG